MKNLPAQVENFNLNIRHLQKRTFSNVNIEKYKISNKGWWFCCIIEKIIEVNLFNLKKRSNFAKQIDRKQLWLIVFFCVVIQIDVNNNTIRYEKKYSSRKLENEQTL